MPTKPAISPQAAQAAVEAHGDRLFRLCFVLLGSSADAEDAVQETLLKYLQSAPIFETAGMCTDGERATPRPPWKSWIWLRRAPKAANCWMP